MNHSRSGGRSLDGGAVRPRASDAQRSRVLHAIDAALVDGRLDRLEHLERTRPVTRSTFVDELRAVLMYEGPAEPGKRRSHVAAEVTVGHVSVFADALGDPEYQVVLFGDDGSGRVTVDDDGEVRDVRQPG